MAGLPKPKEEKPKNSTTTENVSICINQKKDTEAYSDVDQKKDL